mmetsp:Transcript_26082/g.61143  ORF Transcript_26082/g.61143 Transcript_26082/m.61143 type:complete len:255 (+) Transcript_26082:646-1410(+)
MAFLAEIANRSKSDASSASDPSEHNVLFPNASEDFEPFRPSSIVEGTIPEDVAATNRGSANFGITGGIKELSDEEVSSDADTSLQELSWDDYIKTQLVEYGGVSEGMIVSLGVGGNPPQVDVRGEVWASTANFTARTESTVTVTNDMGEDEEMTVNEAELLVQFMMKGSKPREGLWIDGKKYMVLRTVQNESASLNSGDTVFTVYAKRPQGGACIAKTNRAMVVGTFDEEFGQTAGLCNQIVIRCATWLKRNGF